MRLHREKDPINVYLMSQWMPGEGWRLVGISNFTSLVLVVVEGMTSIGSGFASWRCQCLTQSEISSRCSHVSVCFGANHSQRETHGLYRQLGMLCCWMKWKRMTRRSCTAGREEVTAGGPVARRRGDLRRNGQRWEENQHWEHGKTPGQKEVSCQQCRLPQRVEIRSLDRADSSWPSESSRRRAWEHLLNNEWEVVWRKGRLIPLRLTKGGRRSWEGKVISETIFFSMKG